MNNLKVINDNHDDSQPTQICLGTDYSVDLSYLNDEQKSALYNEYAKGVMELSLTAQSYQLETQALKQTLHHLSDNIDEVTIKGGSITLSHTQKTKVGATEILIGNTRKAKAGKLASVQKGQEDHTLLYVVTAIIFLTVVITAAA